MRVFTVIGVGCVILIGCASAQTKSSTTQGASKSATCGVEGFTKSSSEHIIMELAHPFRVRFIEGVVTSQGGDWPEGTTALVELRSSNGASKIKHARTDPQGLFKLPDVPPGEYCFKATADGWQSVVGVSIVSKEADPTNKVNFKMRLGVCRPSIPIDSWWFVGGQFSRARAFRE